MFHSGELALQAQADAIDRARQLGRSIRDSVPPIAAKFLQQQVMVVIATQDSSAQVFATALAGDPGFVETPRPQLIRIQASPPIQDPAWANLAHRAPMGLVAVDFAAHRRMRVNGMGYLTDSGIALSCVEVYSNCGRHIATRALSSRGHREGPTARVISTALTAHQQGWISKSDTFFIATSHPDTGMDVSHKGGAPGFVHVNGAGQIVFPDYPGNFLFNTLGNIRVNPRIGMIFLDFSSGSTLQIAGTAALRQDDRGGWTVYVTPSEVHEVRDALPITIQARATDGT